jgi:hypothetical protein
MSPNSAIDNATASAIPGGFALCVRLAFCLVAAPAGWALHLLVNTSIAGKNCAGAAVSEVASQPWSQAIWAIYIVDFIAVCLAIAAGYLAYELWTKSTDETANAMHRSVHSGEGRTRFLALWAMLSSILFGFAIVAGALGVFVGPTC